MNDRDELVIWTDDDLEADSDSGARGWRETLKGVTGRLRPVPLKASIVEASMAKFVRIVGGIFQQANAQVPPESGISLEEIEVAVKISAKGQAQLIAGGEAGTEGGITLKFKRTSKA
jgi:hypothetical protein